MRPNHLLPASEASPLARALAARLAQFESLTAALTAHEYATGRGPCFFNASIGAHVRHCLDHVRALAEGVATGHIEYDHRERGTLVETDPTEARAHTTDLIHRMEALATLPGSTALRVLLMASHDEPEATVDSTLGRELAFILSHTIHHQAMIRSMLASDPSHAGLELCGTFGLAPATTAHQHGSPCAR